MEIVIALILVAGIVYYLFRKHNESEAELNQAPYKAETPTMEPVKTETPESVTVVVEEIQFPKVEVVQPTLVSTNSQITDSVTQAAEKKPRKPRQNKQSATQKAPVIQAAPKARKPRAPKAK
jgi:hypothetical protein